MKKVIFYILGLIMSIIGLFFCFLNLNLFTIGYSLGKYGKFIISNIECNILFMGLLIIILVYERG